MAWNSSSQEDQFIIPPNRLESPEDLLGSKKKRKNGLSDASDFQTSSSGGVSSTYREQYSSSLNFNRQLGTHSRNPWERTRRTGDELDFPSTEKGLRIMPGATLQNDQPPKKVSNFNRQGIIHQKKLQKISPPKRKFDSIQDVVIPKQDQSQSPPRQTRAKRGKTNRGDSLTNAIPAPKPALNTQRLTSTLHSPKTKSHSAGRPSLKKVHESTTHRKSARLSLKHIKVKKSTEVIDLLDVTDSDTEEECENKGSTYKHRLAEIVNADVKIHTHIPGFGELVSFPLKEIYIGNERYAFKPPVKNKRNCSTRRFSAQSQDSDVNTTETSSTGESEGMIKACSVTVNLARFVLKITIPFSASTVENPLGVQEEISLDHIISVRYFRVANSIECCACLQVEGVALRNFKRITPHANNIVDVPTESLVNSEGVTSVLQDPFHVLFIFPDETSLCGFDSECQNNVELSKRISPKDLTTFLREVSSEDVEMYNACKVPEFYDKYFVLAHKLGVPNRSELRMSRKTRRKASAAKYNDSDAGKTLFCFPNDENAQDTITFCKSDYIRLTDGEFLNDNIIDLQMKRSVLRKGIEVKEKQASTESKSTTPQKLQVQSPSISSNQKNHAVEENARVCSPSPHNTSPVYSFSCMFFTKLTENLKGGYVTKSNMVDAHRVVSRWTKHVDIFEKDFLFFPINIGAHWSLVCVVRPGEAFAEMERKWEDEKDYSSKNYACMLFLDSLAVHDKTKILQSIACYLMQEWHIRKGTERDFMNKKKFPRIDLCKKIPAQLNSYDCGVYLTMYAEYICQKYPTSTMADLHNKFSDWFFTSIFNHNDVEIERAKIMHFCDTQTELWSEIQSARKKKKYSCDNSKKDENKIVAGYHDSPGSEKRSGVDVTSQTMTSMSGGASPTLAIESDSSDTQHKESLSEKNTHTSSLRTVNDFPSEFDAGNQALEVERCV